MAQSLKVVIQTPLDLNCLRNLIFSACSYKYCGGELTIAETARSGLASTVRITCCNEEPVFSRHQPASGGEVRTVL